MRVFLDANVLFSAANPSSNIARLVGLLVEHWEALSSDFAVEEARRNVLVKRSAWSESLEALLAGVRVMPSVRFRLPVQLADKDQPILCTAIRCQCGYLATGDRQDFGHLFDHTVLGVTIVPPARLAEIVVEELKKAGAGDEGEGAAGGPRV